MTASVSGGLRRAATARLSQRSNLLYAVLDQGCSSLSNLGLNIAVASSSSTEVFGALGLVVALYLLEFGVIYGAIVEPYTVARPEERGAATPSAASASVVIGVLLAGLHVGAAALTSGAVSSMLLAYGLATPGLIVQVAGRGLLIAQGRTVVTLWSSVIWLGVQACLSLLAIQAGSSIGLLVAWAVGGWVSGAFCLWHLGVGVHVGRWTEWFRGRTRLAMSWTGDQLAQNGLAQVMVFSLAAVAGLSAVGAYRGALQLTGPATVVVTGLRQAVLPGAARRARAADGSLRRAIRRLSVVFPVMTFLLVGPFLVLPSAVGEQILGETWEEARRVLPWILVMRMASTATTAVSVGMRAIEDSRATLRLRALGGVATVLGCTAAGAAGGALGASVAMALVSVALIPLWNVAFERGITHDRGRPGG